MPYQPAPIPPRYRPLRKIALVSIVLMGLTAVAAVIQSVLLWSSYDDVKRFVYGLLTEEEIDRGIESIAGTGPLLNLVSYLLMGTAVAFLIWLWQARENTDFLHSPLAPRHGPPVDPAGGLHRRVQGWVVGSWFCPIVQFWYPLEIVQDVATASEPLDQPGATKTGRMRTLLYGWWASWTGFWVILIRGRRRRRDRRLRRHLRPAGLHGPGRAGGQHRLHGGDRPADRRGYRRLAPAA
jgi:hypothetical protein